VNIIPIAVAKRKQENVDVAWHIYAALSQYHAKTPAVSELPGFGKAVVDAHANFERLFVK
jgi:hypothetical protein